MIDGNVVLGENIRTSSAQFKALGIAYREIGISSEQAKQNKFHSLRKGFAQEP